METAGSIWWIGKEESGSWEIDLKKSQEQAAYSVNASWVHGISHGPGMKVQPWNRGIQDAAQELQEFEDITSKQIAKHGLIRTGGHKWDYSS